jgi:RHS repeat-associated protein
MRARYYDNTASRFTRPDSARDLNAYHPSSFNLYAYAANNPISRWGSDRLER